MSTEIQTQLSFEDRLKEMIRKGIGDLMTEDDLRKIIERGIENALFEPRLSKDRWGSTVSEASIVDTVIREQMNGKIREGVTRWLLENPEKVEKALTMAINQGMAKCVLDTLDERFSYNLPALLQNAKNNGMI